MHHSTDFQHNQIAWEQYRNHELGDDVIVDDGNGGKLTIGYVSEVIDYSPSVLSTALWLASKGVIAQESGLQVYVVTDIQLPEHPTSEDYAKVKRVTVLYRGSTGLNELPAHPIDVTGDWLFNNAPMTKHIVSPDWLPFQGPTPQLEKAADFANDMMGRYSNAYFDFYGHSLGSMNIQYSVVSLDENYHNRVSGVYVYSGPNIYKILDESKRQAAVVLHDRIYNYVDSLDFVGLGYDQKEGAVGQVVVMANWLLCYSYDKLISSRKVA